MVYEFDVEEFVDEAVNLSSVSAEAYLPSSVQISTGSARLRNAHEHTVRIFGQFKGKTGYPNRISACSILNMR